jgi:hypothetical protein
VIHSGAIPAGNAIAGQQSSWSVRLRVSGGPDPVPA